MADTEISNLRQLPADLVESDDVLAIVSVAASETMKVPALTLVTEGIKNIADDSVPPSVIDWSNIENGAINGTAIADRSIENTKLVLGTITVSEIADSGQTIFILRCGRET